MREPPTSAVGACRPAPYLDCLQQQQVRLQRQACDVRRRHASQPGAAAHTYPGVVVGDFCESPVNGGWAAGRAASPTLAVSFTAVRVAGRSRCTAPPRHRSSQAQALLDRRHLRRGHQPCCTSTACSWTASPTPAAFSYLDVVAEPDHRQRLSCTSTFTWLSVRSVIVDEVAVYNVALDRRRRSRRCTPAATAVGPAGCSPPTAPAAWSGCRRQPSPSP